MQQRVGEIGLTESSAAPGLTIYYLPCGSTPAAFIQALYQDALGRPVDQGSLAAWITALNHGLGRVQLALNVLTSLEGRRHLVDQVYSQYLGRPADPSGLAVWVQFLAQGGTDEQFRSQLLGSPEYFGRAGGTNASFVQALYQDVLGRPVDPAGLTAALTALGNGAGRNQLAFSVLTSDEGRHHLVVRLYQQYLGRTPDQMELSTWVTFLAQGGSDEQLRAQLLGSAEYLARHGC